MDSFITWEALVSYSTFVGVVFTAVEATKKFPYIKEMPTRGWSFLISFVLLCIVNVAVGTFEKWDILLYAISSLYISLSANGLSNLGDKKTSKDEGSEQE